MNLKTENLFSYGTLQQESVQFTTFGRVLEGKPDRVAGHRITLVPITDDNVITATRSTHHQNIQPTGVASDYVDGTVFAVSSDELEQADAYERPANYRRVLLQLESGDHAWVYLHSHE
jgi:gamma-glutamyl AIG2-like cyclotransferase